MMDNKERIAQTRRQEHRNEKLMTSLSHDIRTPLTSIIGHLDAVHYQYIHGEMNAESVRQAREKAYVLKDYLDDLFQWFKLNSKEEKAEMEPLDIVEETRAVLQIGLRLLKEMEYPMTLYQIWTRYGLAWTGFFMSVL